VWPRSRKKRVYSRRRSLAVSIELDMVLPG
jgi:hypothetical protein